MTKFQAINILENKIKSQQPLAWIYAGSDYQDEIMGAETALNSLLGNDSWMTEQQAIDFAVKIGA